MFDSVLVADRGPGAERLLQALQDLGVKAIGVYTDADRDAPHVALADEAVLLGDAAGYADPLRVVEAARQSGAQAVHPGTGPLSGHPGARELAERAGLAWLEGPDELPALLGADRG
ncbi:MAG: acetyl/propionyl-CoA carboxylase subunit alpha [Frankiales bacterium]|nr:acetyl/propionyl-CoA carboxylase subunit alpha [Frankiales bacterium]